MLFNARKIEPGIDILVDGHVHFPNDKAQCKHLLKMFCDEIYRGTFTNAVFETNSSLNAAFNSTSYEQKLLDNVIQCIIYKIHTEYVLSTKKQKSES